LQIRVLVFSKFSGSVKFGIFSGGSFPNLCFSKIGSCFWFKKFRVKFAQVAKIGFKVFSQSLGKQIVSFCKVRFCGLCFFWQSQVSKIGYIFSAKVLAGLVQALVVEPAETFCQVYFFWHKSRFAKSVFSKGFGKFLALAFW